MLQYAHPFFSLDLYSYNDVTCASNARCTSECAARRCRCRELFLSMIFGKPYTFACRKRQCLTPFRILNYSRCRKRHFGNVVDGIPARLDSIKYRSPRYFFLTRADEGWTGSGSIRSRCVIATVIGGLRVAVSSARSPLVLIEIDLLLQTPICLNTLDDIFNTEHSSITFTTTK